MKVKALCEERSLYDAFKIDILEDDIPFFFLNWGHHLNDLPSDSKRLALELKIYVSV